MPRKEESETSDARVISPECCCRQPPHWRTVSLIGLTTDGARTVMRPPGFAIHCLEEVLGNRRRASLVAEYGAAHDKQRLNADVRCTRGTDKIVETSEVDHDERKMGSPADLVAAAARERGVGRCVLQHDHVDRAWACGSCDLDAGDVCRPSYARDRQVRPDRVNTGPDVSRKSARHSGDVCGDGGDRLRAFRAARCLFELAGP